MYNKDVSIPDTICSCFCKETQIPFIFNLDFSPAYSNGVAWPTAQKTIPSLLEFVQGKYPGTSDTGGCSG